MCLGPNVLVLCVCVCIHMYMCAVHMCVLALPAGEELDLCSHSGVCKWKKVIPVYVGH